MASKESGGIKPIVVRMNDLRQTIERERDIRSTWPERVELNVLAAKLRKVKRQTLKEV